MAGAHSRIGEADWRIEAHRDTRVSRGRERGRQRLRAGALSGNIVLRAVDSPARCGGWAALVPGRKQASAEAEDERVGEIPCRWFRGDRNEIAKEKCVGQKAPAAEAFQNFVMSTGVRPFSAQWS